MATNKSDTSFITFVFHLFKQQDVVYKLQL